jgi:hypothetical protein
MLVRKVRMGFRLEIVWCLVHYGSLASAQIIGPSNVISAHIDGVEAVTEKAGIHVAIKNAGERPITAFSVGFSHVNISGERVPCGGRGIDMIDWSDPMPTRNLYVHMRRNWIPPAGTATLDGYPRCPDGVVPIQRIQAELRFILFDDGSGEGDSAQIDAALWLRKQARDERLKWMPRFIALRGTADVKAPALSLYQDLVEATRAAEIDPDNATAQGAAGPVRDEMQQLALEITQWTSHGQSLKKSELLLWLITDLEQRTARLTKGAGRMSGDQL